MNKLPPASAFPVLSQDAKVYDLQSLKYDLQTSAPTMKSWLFPPVRAILERDNKIPQTLKNTELDEQALFIPVHLPNHAECFPRQQLVPADAVSKANAANAVAGAAVRANTTNKGRPVWSAAQLRTAYASGHLTPIEVAKNALKYIAESQDTRLAMSYFIACDARDVVQQAEEATARYRDGKPLSALDGVPYAVKDMIDAVPYQTTCGTTYMTTLYKAEQDHPMVAAMRATGAVLLGKTNLHELGVSPLGVNMHYGIARNPHDPNRFAGGSSSGSAAAVAAGLCPFAIGNDGGGSIRVPAACCGVVGLKPTWGRDYCGGGPKGITSLTCTGPIAASVADALLMYAVIGNAGDKLQSPSPPVNIPQSLASSGQQDTLHGKRLGIFWDWFNDADPEVVDVCKAAVNVLCAKGAEIVPISIPDMDAARISHNYTFGSEAASSHMQELQDLSLRRQMAADVRITLGISKSFKSQQFIQAQRMRRRMVVYMEKVFDAVDFVVTPTIPHVAPKIRPDILSAGESDLTTVGRLLRYVFLSNFTGLPAIALPVGQNSEGMPISLQVIGRAWAEADLLSIGSILEHTQPVAATPTVHYDIGAPTV